MIWNHAGEHRLASRNRILLSNKFFSRLINHAEKDEVSIDAKSSGRWLKKLSDDDLALMTKADCPDVLKLTRTLRAVHVSLENERWLVCWGFSELQSVPDGLVPTDVTPALLCLSVEEADVRTPQQTQFLDALVNTSRARVRHLSSGKVFYRAQLGHGWRSQEVSPGHHEEFPSAHGPKRMVPDPKLVGDGRVNARGIACLYLATNENAAAMEVRPLLGSSISIAQFRTVRDLKLVDCTEKLVGNFFRFGKAEWSDDEIESQVWTDINDAFSRPVGRADTELAYVPTQIVAETLRLAGYDGVAYKSGHDETAFNIALFDLNAARLVSCGLFEVEKLRVELRMADNPYYVSSDDNS